MTDTPRDQGDDLRDRLARALWDVDNPGVSLDMPPATIGHDWALERNAARVDALLPVVTAHTDAALAEAWPCDNYRRPVTCLTAPCAYGSECHHCAEQMEKPVARALAEQREQIVAAIEKHKTQAGNDAQVLRSQGNRDSAGRTMRAAAALGLAARTAERVGKP